MAEYKPDKGIRSIPGRFDIAKDAQGAGGGGGGGGGNVSRLPLQPNGRLDHRELGKAGLIDMPRATKATSHTRFSSEGERLPDQQYPSKNWTNEHIDYYDRNGDKKYGKVIHQDGGGILIQPSEGGDNVRLKFYKGPKAEHHADGGVVLEKRLDKLQRKAKGR